MMLVIPSEVEESLEFAYLHRHRAMMLEQYLRIFLLASTQRAADGIEPK